MSDKDIAAKIRPYIAVDDSGQDLDTIEVRYEDGDVRTALFDRALCERIEADSVTLPGGERFSRDDLQLAFQDALIEKTGRCVLEDEYRRAGFPLLERLARSARGETAQTD